MKLDRMNILVGVTTIVVGVIFLLDNFNIMPEIFEISKLWPVFVIIGGIFVIFSRDMWK